MTSYETITLSVDPKLYKDLTDWNFYHKKDKINRSAVCRIALMDALNEKKRQHE